MMNSSFRLILIIFCCFLIGLGLGFVSFRSPKQRAGQRVSIAHQHGKWAGPTAVHQETNLEQNEPSSAGEYSSPTEVLVGLCEDAIQALTLACESGNSSACWKMAHYFQAKTHESKAVVDKLFSICESENHFSDSYMRMNCKNALEIQGFYEPTQREKQTARMTSLCEQGNVGACEILLSLFFEREKEKALKKIFSLCDSNDFEACELLVRNENEPFTIDKLGGLEKKYFSMCQAGTIEACGQFVTHRMGGSPELALALQKIVHACSSSQPPVGFCFHALKVHKFEPAKHEKIEDALLTVCVRGDAPACIELLSVSSLKEARREAAIKKIHSLCDEKNAEACIWVANDPQTNDSQRKPALDTLHQACQSKNAAACFFLGDLYRKNCARDYAGAPTF